MACQSKEKTIITYNELLESKHRKPNYIVQLQLLNMKGFMSDLMRSISLLSRIQANTLFGMPYW